MTVQTTYGFIAPAVAGQIVDMYFNEIVSKLVETATGLGFGIAVGRGTGDNQCVVGGALGISVRELTREMDQRGAAAVTKYILGNAAAIMRKGHLYVTLGGDDAVDAGDGLGYIAATGVICAASATGATAVSNWYAESTGVVGDIIEIRLA